MRIKKFDLDLIFCFAVILFNGGVLYFTPDEYLEVAFKGGELIPFWIQRFVGILTLTVAEFFTIGSIGSLVIGLAKLRAKSDYVEVKDPLSAMFENKNQEELTALREEIERYKRGDESGLKIDDK